MKIKNFKNNAAEDGFSNVSITFQEIQYLNNYPGEYNERIYLVIPASRVPEIIDSLSTSN